MFPIRDTLSWQRFPAVVAALILVNVLVYVYQLSLSQPELQHFLYHHGLVPKRYFVPSWGEKVGLSPLDPNGVFSTHSELPSSDQAACGEALSLKVFTVSIAPVATSRI